MELSQGGWDRRHLLGVTTSEYLWKEKAPLFQANAALFQDTWFEEQWVSVPLCSLDQILFCGTQAAPPYTDTLKVMVNAQSLSCVRLLATLWTVAHQASLSMGFSRKEYWSKLFPPPEDLPDSEIKPMAPTLTNKFFTSVLPGSWR